MKAWEHVINTAMLGTDKLMIGNTELPEEIVQIANAIEASETLDIEEKYLKKASIIYNYRQCGFVPLQKQDIPLNKANAETSPYCSDLASGVLNDILEDGNDLLLELWLTHCDKSQQLILPDVLPTILDKAQKNQTLQTLAIKCSGNRGTWLSNLNPLWDFFTVLPDEEIWQSGTLAQRVVLLKKMRQTEPAKAREWLQQTWTQENAANKVDLLKTLKTNCTPADLPWLESLLAEKGQKVKDEVIAILKQIPGSSIVKRYEDLLQQSVILKKEKALMGMMTKVSIQQRLPAAVDESIYKSGVEKLSGPKSNITDEQFVIYQLVCAVPPSFWEKQFDALPIQVIEYFEKYADALVAALSMAVSRFDQKEWMPYFLNHENKFYMDFVNVLPTAERDKYLLRLLKKEAQNIIPEALKCNQEWGDELALAVIREMANNTYQYNRGVYNQYIGLIPVSILHQLEKIETADINMQSTWTKTRDHLTKLLGLKQRTLKAFNA